MNGVLIGLIDRIRMLDNDLIRLRSKLNTILTIIRENQKRKNQNNIFINISMKTLLKKMVLVIYFNNNSPEYINTSIVELDFEFKNTHPFQVTVILLMYYLSTQLQEQRKKKT